MHTNTSFEAEVALPWIDSEIVASLDEFFSVYQSRPIKENKGGMGAPHLFATWFMVKTLKPRVIIESGIWKGLGTWFLEQAAPEAKVFSLDPNLSKREYISPKATYDSIDFSEVNWSIVDPSEALIFFDDHQNAYTRLMQCRWFGFKRVIFEDNYLPGKGDFYSLRHIFEGAGFGNFFGEEKARYYRSFPAKLRRRFFALAKLFDPKTISAIPQYCRDHVAPNGFDAHFVKKNLEVYYEFPPLFAPSGCETSGKCGIKAALLGDEAREKYPILYQDRNRYNQISYVQLK